MLLQRYVRVIAGLAIMGALSLVAGGAAAAMAQASAVIAQASVVDSPIHADGDVPTFFSDVLPILEKNCQVCHQPAGRSSGGMVAPMSFVTFEETRPWARVIARAVSEGVMPPWQASRMHIGTFRDERYLTPGDIQTLVAWAEAGAPEGTRPAGWQPLAAEASEGGWTMGEPDLIIRPDEPFCLADDLNDLYINLPATITAEMMPEDRWVKSVEYRSGPHVHHIIQSDWGGLVPGGKPRLFEDGYGRIMRAGPRTTTFNMHYNKPPGPGTALCDFTEVGVRFMEDGEVIKYVTGGNNLMIRDFKIPAGESSYSHSLEYTFERDVYLRSFMPHMHLRGKAALYELTRPDGSHEILLHVPKYDFNWQHTYEFKEPPLVPKGSVLRMTLWWDNSEDNKWNPDPTADVGWGLPTYLEMGQGYMNWREVQERHIVVGQAIAADVREAATDETDDPHLETDAH